LGSKHPLVQSIVEQETIDYSYGVFDRLKHFLLVVEAGSFTAAAKRAHLTQPALTASIQRLEAQLGASLIVRGHRGAALTAAGDALLPRARAAMAAVADGERAVHEIVGLQRGVIRLGAGATVCTYYLPPLLAKFRKLHPGVQIFVREALMSDILLLLERGELDLGVVTHPTAKVWYEDELVLVTSARGPYKPRSCDPESAPFVTFPKGATTRELLERSFPRAPIVMELSGIASIKSNVRAGVGIALISRRAVERDLRARSLTIIKHAKTPIARSFSLLHRGLERTPPAALALYRLLLEWPERKGS
jgi:DNA-binding transcriptional LysR family regulator